MSTRFSLISIDPRICHGQACVKGTRIPVHQILGMLAGGDKIEDLLEAYPALSREAILCLPGLRGFSGGRAGHPAGTAGWTVMRLLVDENIPRATAQALKDLGHDVRDLPLGGTPCSTS